MAENNQKKDRLADALRANLRRRKSQTKARTAQSKQPAPVENDSQE